VKQELQEIEALIARMTLGERAAFRELYSRTSAKLFGIILRVLNDRTEAEEVLQESFVRSGAMQASIAPTGSAR
jgi:RNA polymerase sigma-70 factor (ECF subfamily)